MTDAELNELNRKELEAERARTPADELREAVERWSQLIDACRSAITQLSIIEAAANDDGLNGDELISQYKTVIDRLWDLARWSASLSDILKPPPRQPVNLLSKDDAWHSIGWLGQWAEKEFINARDRLIASIPETSWQNPD